MLLTSVLLMKSSLAANKYIPTNEGNINMVDDNKRIFKVDVVGNKSGTEFLSPKLG